MEELIKAYNDKISEADDILMEIARENLKYQLDKIQQLNYFQTYN